ncbi:hypothetical protein QN361_25075, partial [Pseudomonas sp. 5C2]|nr:hypothetical protein [Pseudomonas sp. 5C2]
EQLDPQILELPEINHLQDPRNTHASRPAINLKSRYAPKKKKTRIKNQEQKKKAPPKKGCKTQRMNHPKNPPRICVK